MNKRHLVLYALGALVLLLGASVFLMAKSDELSDRQATTTPPVASEIIATSSTAKAVASLPASTTPFKFEIVTTRAAQEKGLGGRKDIPENYGMLFVFNEKQTQGFWMKGMLVPIDIIWISDAGVAVGIEASVSPTTYPNVFYSPEPVRYVLETKAGEAARLGISTGTKLNLPLPYGK